MFTLLISTIMYTILFILIFSYQLKDIKKGILKAIFWEIGIFSVCFLLLLPLFIIKL